MSSASTPKTTQGRDLLIQVARRLFLERGYTNVSIQQIATEAEMTKGAPYYHFASKQDLFIQVSMGIIADVRDTLNSAMQTEGSFQQRLESATIEAVRSISGDFSQWFSDMFREIDKASMQQAITEEFGFRVLPNFFLPLFEAAKANGDIGRVSPDVAARVYFMLLKSTIDTCGHGSVEYPGSELGVDTEQLVREVIDIYFRGIA
ncbi:MAG: TetR/AcrR family transcriptional regulator [Thermomicrobiales bacterium]